MNFEEFANLSARFLVEEEEDTEAILRELKDAFRLYDKEGELVFHVLYKFYSKCKYLKQISEILTLRSYI